jgi:hypothetical protein
MTRVQEKFSVEKYPNALSVILSEEHPISDVLQSGL